MKYKTILFDLDGTLADTKSGILKSAKATLKILGAAPPPDRELARFLGPPVLESFTEVCGLSPQLALEASGIYRRHLMESGNVFDCTAFAGMEELLQALKAAGCRLGVATSKAENIAIPVLRHMGLFDYFDAVCGPAADNLSATKADSIRRALALLQGTAPESAVLVGDRSFDAQGAVEAGIDSIGVFYGYGEREEIRSSLFTFTCETAEELKRLLLADQSA